MAQSLGFRDLALNMQHNKGSKTSCAEHELHEKASPVALLTAPTLY